MPVIFRTVEVDNLYCDEILEATVVGFVDSAHTALPEVGEDLITTIKNGPDI